MINYYEIIGVPKLASTDEIKKKTKLNIKKIKESNISQNQKNKELRKMEDAYTFLTDYHKRQKLDIYLDKNYTINFSRPFSIFDQLEGSLKPLDKFTIAKPDFEFPDFSQFKNINSKFIQHSSTISSNSDKNGNIITEKKITTNNNGQIDGSHTITTIDKEGNEIIKDIPINKDSKNKNLVFFLN